MVNFNFTHRLEPCKNFPIDYLPAGWTSVTTLTSFAGSALENKKHKESKY